MATPSSLRNKVFLWVGGGTIGVASTILVGQLKTQEGFSPTVYKDPVGIQTYCYGETHNPDPSRTYSKEYCEYLLSHKASDYIRKVRALVPHQIYLSPQELAAWGSFSYNVGLPTFQKSTALKLLKSGRRHAACRQLPRWVYATESSSGKRIRLRGLENRREVEKELCLLGASQGDA